MVELSMLILISLRVLLAGSALALIDIDYLDFNVKKTFVFSTVTEHILTLRFDGGLVQIVKLFCYEL